MGTSFQSKLMKHKVKHLNSKILQLLYEPANYAAAFYFESRILIAFSCLPKLDVINYNSHTVQNRDLYFQQNKHLDTSTKCSVGKNRQRQDMNEQYTIE